MEKDKEVVSFADPAPPMSRNRETVALAYVKRLLARSAPEAIRFQRQLMNDVAVDPGLRFKASEAILDRFVGKASQEIRVGVAESRPLVFNSKLQVLRDGLQAADNAHAQGKSAYEAFSTSVINDLADNEGVTI